ncbi:MAG: lysyl oxidase family protein [Solirubrobacterales bacterium]
MKCGIGGFTATFILVAAIGLGLSASAGARGNGPCQPKTNLSKLRCPDLRVGKPSEMYADRVAKDGRVLLRSTNDIKSRGRGPMELRGRRDRQRSMNVTQAIRRRAGGYSLFPTQARLRFFNVGSYWGGSFWKVARPLRFELWKVGNRGRKRKLVRTGPKQFYCFRDLVRTKPSGRSPDIAVYPACNQDPNQRRVTLGTSVGWSDIYPSSYDHQWIDVTGLRGCYAYLLRVDPQNRLFELNKKNNTAQRTIRLPWRGPGHRGC